MPSFLKTMAKMLLIMFTFLNIGLALPRSSCGQISCEEPKAKDKWRCEIVPSSDKSLPLPSGPNAACCSLWRCYNNNGALYTIHGVLPKSGGGGKETVHYSKDRSLVSSLATGDHDSTANAGGGGGAVDISEALGIIKGAVGGTGVL